MGIKHVAYLIALTVDTTYWGSYTDLIPHISLFCMLQQNRKEIMELSYILLTICLLRAYSQFWKSAQPTG